MTIDEIRIAASPGETRAAFLADGRLIRYVVDRPGETLCLGDVVLGRVKRVVTGLDAAFVDVGAGQDGFLGADDAVPPGAARRRIGACVHEGAAVVVEVIREATPVKGPKLRIAADPEAATPREGRRAPVRLARGPGPVQRALAALATPACRRIVVDAPDMAAWLRAARPDLADRVTVLIAPGRDAFADTNVADQLASLLRPSVPLPSGGSVSISETPALVAIDVDSGGADGRTAAQTGLAVNLEAADEVARQIGLRSLAGQMVVDFIPMRRRDHRSAVLARLGAALADVGASDVDVAGYTRLGLVEMRRRRTGPTLAEMLRCPCPRCEGSGMVDSPLTLALAALRAALAADRASPGAALAIEAVPEVAAVLAHGVAAARAETEARLGRPLEVHPAATRPACGFVVNVNGR